MPIIPPVKAPVLPTLKKVGRDVIKKLPRGLRNPITEFVDYGIDRRFTATWRTRTLTPTPGAIEWVHWIADEVLDKEEIVIQFHWPPSTFDHLFWSGRYDLNVKWWQFAGPVGDAATKFQARASEGWNGPQLEGPQWALQVLYGRKPQIRMDLGPFDDHYFEAPYYHDPFHLFVMFNMEDSDGRDTLIEPSWRGFLNVDPGERAEV